MEQRDIVTATALEARLYHIIAEPLAAMGYVVVHLKLMESQRRRVLSCVAEREDGALMTIEDCEAISTTVSALFDVEDPIQHAYQLEVSSPGLERPLTRLQDFAQYAGHEAQLELTMPINNRKRYRAKLEGVEGEEIKLSFEKQTLSVPFSRLKAAHLIASEALFRELLKASGAEKTSGRFQKQKRQGKAKKKDHKKHTTNVM